MPRGRLANGTIVEWSQILLTVPNIRYRTPFTGRRQFPLPWPTKKKYIRELRPARMTIGQLADLNFYVLTI